MFLYFQFHVSSPSHQHPSPRVQDSDDGNGVIINLHVSLCSHIDFPVNLYKQRRENVLLEYPLYFNYLINQFI